MGRKIALREDFDGPDLRRLAMASKDAGQCRRLLALAEIYDGAKRTDAARLGDVGLQVVRDWVLRFNAKGPAGLIDGKATGAHAVLIIDRAAWHTTGKLTVPPNITLLLLPPRAPELNPVENIWLFMRDNWLSNRIFKSYDEIVAICCEAWNKLIDQPWKIMSIGRRKWTHGF